MTVSPPTRSTVALLELRDELLAELDRLDTLARSAVGGRFVWTPWEARGSQVVAGQGGYHVADAVTDETALHVAAWGPLTSQRFTAAIRSEVEDAWATWEAAGPALAPSLRQGLEGALLRWHAALLSGPAPT